MLDFSFGKLAIIFTLCLIVLGPEKLPKLAQTLGRFAGQARAMARHFRAQLEEEIAAGELAKQKQELEAAVKGTVDAVSSPISTITQSVTDTAHDATKEVAEVKEQVASVIDEFPSANNSGHVDYSDLVQPDTAPPPESPALSDAAHSHVEKTPV